MSWYSGFKLFHIVSVIVFVGGLIARQLVRGAAKGTDDVQVFANLNQAAGIMEKYMVIPGSLATTVLGIILALMAGYPIFGFLQGAAQNWLLVSNLLLVSVIVIIPTIFLPRGKKFEPLLQAALQEGRITPQLRAAMEDKVVKSAHLYEEIAMIIIVVLMVLKPF